MDDVFRALADPSRRALLDRLRENDGRSLGELADGLPSMTRFGVASHLDVLERAGLVTSLRDGRHRRHYLNAVPLREVAARWLTPYTAARADRLLDLRHLLETPATKETPMTSTTTPATATAETTSVYRISIRADRARVWAALTDVGVRRSWLYDSIATSTWQVGAPYTISDEAGTELIVGVVQESDPPSRLLMTFDPRWDEETAAEAPGTLEYRLHDAGDGITELTVVTGGVAGSSTESAEESNPEIYSALKTVLETGTPLRASA